jgi:hypothetical protein
MGVERVARPWFSVTAGLVEVVSEDIVPVKVGTEETAPAMLKAETGLVGDKTVGTDGTESPKPDSRAEDTPETGV